MRQSPQMPLGQVTHFTATPLESCWRCKVSPGRHTHAKTEVEPVEEMDPVIASSHCRGVEEFNGQYVPGEHCMACLVDAGQNCPGGHDLGSHVPVGHNRPAGHGEGRLVPEFAQYEPLGQGLQWNASVSLEKVPAGQTLHKSSIFFPSPSPTTSLKVPAAHD